MIRRIPPLNESENEFKPSRSKKAERAKEINNRKHEKDVEKHLLTQIKATSLLSNNNICFWSPLRKEAVSTVPALFRCAEPPRCILQQHAHERWRVCAPVLILVLLLL